MAANTQVIYDTVMALAVEIERARPPQPQPQPQAIIDVIQALQDEMRNGFNHLHEEIQQARAETQQVRADVTTLSTRMVGFEGLMIKRLDASDINMTARLYNSTINNAITSFHQMRNHNNEEVQGFPINGGQLKTLGNRDLMSLLRAFGQPEDGEIEAKRHRFALFIGVISPVL